MNNLSKMCFWTFAHIIAEPDLLAAVRAETDSACSSKGEIDIDILSSRCPQLEAVWYEALRVYNNANAVRKAEKDCSIGGKLIHTDDTVMGRFHRYLQNKDVFGEDTEIFDAGRILRTNNLNHSKWFSPFGGGRTLCPGRVVAQREVFLFVAVVLKRFDFDLDLDGGRSVVPEVNENIPLLTIMAPLTEMVVKIAERKRWNWIYIQVYEYRLIIFKLNLSLMCVSA